MILFYWLVAIMPLDRHPLWSHLFGDLTLFKYIGALCVIYTFLYLPSRRRPPIFLSTWQARFYFLLTAIAAVSYITKSVHVAFFLSPMFSFLSFVGLFFITVSVVDSARRLRWVLVSAVGSVAFASVYIIREWQKAGFDRAYRPGWIVGDPNYFGVSALVCVPVAAYFIADRERPVWERLFYLFSLGLTMVALLAGQSRGAFLGLTAATLWALWNSRQRVRNFILLILLALPLLLVLPISPLGRLFHPDKSTQWSTENHVAILFAGLRMIKANPVIGVGLGNFKSRVLGYADNNLHRAFIAHNSYIEVAAEMGLPTLAVYLAIVGFSFLTYSKVRKAARERGQVFMENAAAGLQAGLLGASVAIFFVSAQYQKLYWFVIFLSMCLPPLLEQTEDVKEKVAASRWSIKRFKAAAPGMAAQPVRRHPGALNLAPPLPPASISGGSGKGESRAFGGGRRIKERSS